VLPFVLADLRRPLGPAVQHARAHLPAAGHRIVGAQAVRGAARARNHEDLTLAVVVGTVRVLPEIERAVVTLVDPLPTTTLVRGRWRARERDERVVGGESRVVLEEARVRGAREGRGRA